MKLQFGLIVYTQFSFKTGKHPVPIIATKENDTYANNIAYVDQRLADLHDREKENPTWKSYPELKKL